MRNEKTFQAGKLVLAARMQNRKDHQVGIGEEPLLGSGARSFGRPGELAEVLGECQGTQVVEADSGEPDYFVLGEKLLARSYADHFRRLLNDSMLKRD
jgi:hypothetical protein